MTDRIPQDLADGAIDAALESASLPALLPALIHLTGDTNLLTKFGQRLPGPKGDEGAGISADNAREIRALAAQALRSLRDGKNFSATALPDHQLMAMIDWSVGELVPPEYLQLLLEEAYFDDRDLRGLQ